MALWKPFRGNRSGLDSVTKHDGYVYFCTDDGSLFFDYVDAEGNLQRKQINAKDAETLCGMSLDEIKKAISWNDLEDRPLVMKSITITYDGNTDGCVASDPALFYKVSDLVLTKENIMGQSISLLNKGSVSTATITEDMISTFENPNSFVIGEFVACIAEDNTTFNSYTFPEKGVYFANLNGIYITSLDVVNVGPFFDEKYISDTIARRKDIVQSDWTEGSESSLSYIKNKTHYYCEGAHLIKELSFTVANEDFTSINPYLTFEEGKKYKVVIDDISDMCTAVHIDDAAAGENCIELTPNIEGFGRVRSRLTGGVCTYIAGISLGDHVLSIYEDNELKQLDEMFIPDTIARVSDIPEQIQSDWSVNDETNPAYVNNRTHYEYNVQDDAVIFEETPDMESSQVRYESDSPNTFVVGNQYIVSLNGVEYTSTLENAPYGAWTLSSEQFYIEIYPDNSTTRLFMIFRECGNMILKITNTDKTVTEIDGVFSCVGSHSFNSTMKKLDVGEAYVVVRDEDEIQCIAKSNENFMYYLGNLYLQTKVESDNTNEPFLIYYRKGNNSYIYIEAEKSVNSLKIKGKTSDIVQLPQKYYNAAGRAGVGMFSEVFNENKPSCAYGISSHAEGMESIAYGEVSHAEGETTLAYGKRSHAEGCGEVVVVRGVTGEPRATTFNYQEDFQIGIISSMSELVDKYVSKDNYYAKITAVDTDAKTFTTEYILSDNAITADMDITLYVSGIAGGNMSHVEGTICIASGFASHAEGQGTVASKTCAHSEGYNTIASGINSHAEGQHTQATATGTHAEGLETIASGGFASHAEGYRTHATARYAHSEGQGTRASGRSQHTQGEYNVIDASSGENARGKYAHIVGNGTSDSARSNAHTLDWSGNAWFAGDIKVGGTGQDDVNAKILATTEYVDSHIAANMAQSSQPRMTTVTLSAENWTGDSNPWSQVITINSVTENSKVDLQPTALQVVALQNDEISLMTQNDGGVITAWAIGNKPTEDYTIQVLITEVTPV